MVEQLEYRMSSQKPVDSHDYMFKVILIGDSGVGKSNILLRYTRDQFSLEHQMTKGVQFATKNVKANGKNVRLQVWDTMGQEQYRAMMKMFYKGASAVLLTYDITRIKTFQNLDYWYDQIKEFCKRGIVIMLVGNKVDLEGERQISKQMGLEFAEKKKIAFYEVSAKEAINVELIFSKIAQGREDKDIELQKIMAESSQSVKIPSSSVDEQKGEEKPSKSVILEEKDQQSSSRRKRNCCN